MVCAEHGDIVSTVIQCMTGFSLTVCCPCIVSSGFIIS